MKFFFQNSVSFDFKSKLVVDEANQFQNEQNDYFLSADETGKVLASSSSNDKYSKWSVIQNQGLSGGIRLQNEENKMFLDSDSMGKLFLTPGEIEFSDQQSQEWTFSGNRLKNRLTGRVLTSLNGRRLTTEKADGSLLQSWIQVNAE